MVGPISNCSKKGLIEFDTPKNLKLISTLTISAASATATTDGETG